VLKGKPREKAQKDAALMPAVSLDEEVAKDAQNIAQGIYSPLEGFLLQEDYERVLHERRLSFKDVYWTIPIVLDVTKDRAAQLKEGEDIALTCNNRTVAVLHLEEKYPYDKKEFARRVFKTVDPSHPGVASLYSKKEILLGGKIDLLEEVESAYKRYALTPRQTRAIFKERGWKTVVGFQTRNVPHLNHEFLQKTALSFLDGLFINPVIGKKKKGDFRDEIILESYRVLIDRYYPKESVVLAILPWEMRYAGPMEAIHHAIIRKNFGCTHHIFGRDHAGVGSFYRPYEAQEVFDQFPDLGITPIFFREFFYCKKCQGVMNEKICPHGAQDRIVFSGTKVRSIFTRGETPPKELMRPEVVEVIKKYPNPFVE
jgi:sulfate adenylyltransferase